MEKKLRSNLWDHAKRVEIEGRMKIKCNYCPKSFVYDSSKCGTSSAKRHVDNCSNNPYRKELEKLNQTKLSLQPMHGGVASGASLTTWRYDKDLCRRKLIEMIILDELPFSIVIGAGFISFVNALQPEFKIPSRFTISRDCYELFRVEKERMWEYFMHSGQTISITTDTWTSIQNLSYMCITAHYIDQNWELNKRIINFRTVESHKGEDMAKVIEASLREWGISKVFVVTVDNASANETCITYLKKRFTDFYGRGCTTSTFVGGKYLHMRCLAHIINLIVGDGLKEMNASIKKVRETIRYVRHSPQRMDRFKKCCEEEHIDCESMLCLDVCTRWNSTYLMLSVAVKFEKAFHRYDVEDHRFKIDLGRDNVPSWMDWEFARKMVKALEAFYHITTRVSASKYVTSNATIDEIRQVKSSLESLICDSDLVVKSMGDKMMLKYLKYWGNYNEMNKMIFMGIVFDPRYKFDYVDHVLREDYGDIDGGVLGESLKIDLNELFEHYKSIHENSSNESLSQAQSSQDTSSTIKSSTSHDSKWRKERREGGVTKKNELDVYLNEDPIDVVDEDFDILKWWRMNRLRFPILALMVRDILAIPISTVASESAFSTGSRVLDPFRSSLLPKVVEALICAQDWLRGSTAPKTIEQDLEDILMDEKIIASVEGGSIDPTITNES